MLDVTFFFLTLQSKNSVPPSSSLSQETDHVLFLYTVKLQYNIFLLPTVEHNSSPLSPRLAVEKKC